MKLGGEIISADSRQVYRGMDIGTGKDLGDYTIDGHKIPYHLIDIADPGTEYNVFAYSRDFEKARNEISSRGKLVVVCGGTGMYLEAISAGYRLEEVPEDPALRATLQVMSLEELTVKLKELKEVHNVTDTSDRVRAIRAIEIAKFYRDHPGKRQEPVYKSVLFGVDMPRQLVRERITQRLHQRLNEGMVQEVEMLLDSGITSEQLKFYGLEYRFITQYVQGEISYEEMFRLLNTAIHQFSKRQMTWFRRMEKQGQEIRWIDGTLPMEEKAGRIVEGFGGRW
jgi:tRNA dimethylallyltransferase